MGDNNVKFLAVYGRVSTSNQENEGTIETQLSAVREFAEKNNFSIVQEYIDEGWSGDTLVRPSLDQLRLDAKKKVWEGVLMYDPDRLARRYSYQELVIDELKETGLEVVFVTTPAPKDSQDKILHGVKGLFAEYERAKISERFRMGKVRKVKEGNILVSEALYGYTYIPKQDIKHGYYEINPEEAEVVKMIFSWVANNGLTIRGIVRKLQELNIKPRKSKRGVWNTSTLTHLLRNKTYIGEAHWGSTYAVVPENPINTEKYRKTKKSSRKMRPEEEWYIIPVPAIINRELFDKARAQLEANFALCQRNKRNEYLLGGKIFCSCGRRRIGEGPQHGKHLYYRCTDRVNNFPLPANCKEKGVNARIADSLVWEKVSSVMGSPELLMLQIEAWVNKQKSLAVLPVHNVGLIKRQLDKLNEQEERYSKAYGAGIFTIEKLKEYISPIKERASELELQIQKSNEQERKINSIGLPTKNEIKEFCKNVVIGLQNLSFNAKRGILLNIVDKIVATQQQLQVYGYIPITAEGYVEYKTSDRHGVNTTRHNSVDKEIKLIPFSLTIDLPPPNYSRFVVAYKPE